MDDVAAKRIFDDRAGEVELLVACEAGVLSVSVSGGSVGRFGLVHRCAPADVAAAGGRVAIATDEEVLLRHPDGAAFEPTGFGPAVAVGFEGATPVAASPDGALARLEVADDAPSWTGLGRLDAAIRAVDGRLVAAADGVHRLPALEYAGLDDVRGVAAAGPLAAAGDGLYSLGNGGLSELAGAFESATAAGGRAHAATADGFFERGPDGWHQVGLPADGRVVDVAYGDVAYAATAGGTLVAEAVDGWRAQPLGVGGVVGVAAGRGSRPGSGQGD